MSSDPNRTLPWSTTAARWARFSAASFVAAFCCCGDTDSAARGECLPTRQADVFDESCFYSYCVGPPLEPNGVYCYVEEPRDEGKLCCDRAGNHAWAYGTVAWYRLGECAEGEVRQYSDCPFLNEDMRTYYGSENVWPGADAWADGQ